MRPLGSCLAGLLFLSQGLPLEAAAPLCAVFIDAQTEATYGSFPFSRTLLAQGVDQIQKAGAKALIIKLFFDQAKDAADDKLLSEAISKLPTVLQADLDDNEANPNPLPERFFVKDIAVPPPRLISASRGWIPVPAILRSAEDVGFVEVSDPNKAFLIERYNGRVVKSLYLCGIELVTGKGATFAPTNRVFFGLESLTYDDQGQCMVTIAKEPKADYIPFHDLVAGKVPKERIKGAVVVLGYDGDSIHSITTSAGTFKAHRYWYYTLRTLCDQVK